MHANELFYNDLDIIVSDFHYGAIFAPKGYPFKNTFQNNDKRKFCKVIRHFVTNNKSIFRIPH